MLKVFGVPQGLMAGHELSSSIPVLFSYTFLIPLSIPEKIVYLNFENYVY